MTRIKNFSEIVRMALACGIVFPSQLAVRFHYSTSTVKRWAQAKVKPPDNAEQIIDYIEKLFVSHNEQLEQLGQLFAGPEIIVALRQLGEE